MAYQKQLLINQKKTKALLMLSSFWVFFGYALMTATVHKNYQEFKGAHANEMLLVMVGIILLSFTLQVMIWFDIGKQQPLSLSATKDTFMFCRQKIIGQRILMIIYLITYLALLTSAFLFYHRYINDVQFNLWEVTAPSSIIVITFCGFFLIKFHNQLHKINLKLQTETVKEN